MAYVNFNPDTGEYDSDTSDYTSLPTPSAPQPAAGGGGGGGGAYPSYETVDKDYNTYLGRSLTQPEYDTYWKNAAGYTAGQVATSAESMARILGADKPLAPKTAPTSSSSGWDTVDAAKLNAYFASRGKTPYPTSIDYWISKWPELVARGREIGNPNYAFDRLSQADEFGGGWSPAPAAGGATSTAGTGSTSSVQRSDTTGIAVGGPNPGDYIDPSSKVYLDQVMQRLIELRTPKVDPWENMLKLFALKRVGDLGKPVYTDAEEQALITQFRDPLTQARDASLQRNKERVSGRGMLASSGLLDELNQGTEHSYEAGIASGDNALQTQAIQEKQRRADQALSILMNLMNVERSGTDRQNALYDQALTTAKMFPDFDQNRFDMMLRASGEGGSSPSSIMGDLNSLAQLGLQSDAAARTDDRYYDSLQRQDSADSSAMWGQIIGALMGSLSK